MTTKEAPNRSDHSAGLLASLHLFGLSHLDPVILAALLDERPMLLLGPPGTAKSALLNRIAAALGLEHRHYNASLIQIDDLLGYPVPNKAQDGLRYLHTPNDLWEAESVFLDEISRARPEVQNRLYAILHERSIQGIRLERLRYRWSAMNPPRPIGEIHADDSEAADHAPTFATHSVPLDPALADRFAWIVPLPGIAGLPRETRLCLLEEGDREPEDGTLLRDALAQARQAQQALPKRARRFAVRWVDSLLVNLHHADVWISGRRAVALVRSVCSLLAALEALGDPAEPERAARLALQYGLPHAAFGLPPDPDILASIHQEAVQVAREAISDRLEALALETDPVRRVAIALSIPSTLIDRQELSRILQETWATLEGAACRYAFSWAIAPVLARLDRFTAHACEMVSRPMRQVLEFTLDPGQRPSPAAHVTPERVKQIDTEFRRLHTLGIPESETLGNLLLTLLANHAKPFDPRTVTDQALEWRALFTQSLRGVKAA